MWNVYVKFPFKAENWPGRLVEGNSADVEFLNLVDGTDGQSAVVCQSQTVKEKNIKQDEFAQWNNTQHSQQIKERMIVSVL